MTNTERAELHLAQRRALIAALKVITQTAHIRDFLTEIDPKALKQADAALDAVKDENPGNL